MNIMDMMDKYEHSIMSDFINYMVTGGVIIGIEKMMVDTLKLKQRLGYH